MGILNIFKTKEEKVIESERVKTMKVKDLKILEFNEFRVSGDLNELMRSIKENGLIHPITIRKSDNAVICGNRRLTAYIKLGYPTIPCRVIEIDDENLYILNLTENLQRKSVSTLEVGKVCYELKSGVVCKRKLTISEIATRLGVSPNRIKNSIFAYKKLPNTEKIKHYHRGTQRKDKDEIPETIITDFRKLYSSKVITDEQFKTLLKAVKDKEITTKKMQKLSFLIRRGLDFDVALKEVDNFVVRNLSFVFNDKERKKLVLKHKKCLGEILRDLIKRKFPKLVY